MSQPHGNRPTLTRTRNRILGLLRAGTWTVEGLAEKLQLTPGAVRAQLAKLVAENLVSESGRQAGVRKPHYLYKLTEGAELLFCRAYVPVTEQILSALEVHLSPAEVENTLREAGRRMAHDLEPQVNLRDRVSPAQTALSIYEEIGGTGTLQVQNGGVLLEGYGCPMSAVVTAHPQVCQLLEELLSAAVGQRVQQNCIRSEHPYCRFQLRPSFEEESVT